MVCSFVNERCVIMEKACLGTNKPVSILFTLYPELFDIFKNVKCSYFKKHDYLIEFQWDNPTERFISEMRKLIEITKDYPIYFFDRRLNEKISFETINKYENDIKMYNESWLTYVFELKSDLLN